MDNSAPVLKTKIVPATLDRYWSGPGVEWTGLGLRKVLLVVTEPVVAPMLSKMMEVGCGIIPSDYFILPVTPGNVPAWHQVQEAFHPKVVILLGVVPADMGVSALFQYQSPNHFGGALWLPGPPAAEIEKDQEVKRQFWKGALEPVFRTDQYGKI